MKQLAFFMNPSRLSWKIISWLSDQIFNANHLIFTGYGISTLLSTCLMQPLDLHKFLGCVHSSCCIAAAACPQSVVAFLPSCHIRPWPPPFNGTTSIWRRWMRHGASMVQDRPSRYHTCLIQSAYSKPALATILYIITCTAIFYFILFLKVLIFGSQKRKRGILCCRVLLWRSFYLRATSHTSQEPWPWNCESPKESVQRPSQHTSKLM